MNKSNQSNWNSSTQQVTSAVSNYSTSSWQASLVLSRTPFCSYNLLQTRYITRHQFLAVFPRNLSPFLKSNGLQFSDILRFACCNSLLQNPPEILYGVTVRATVESSRTSSVNQILVEFEVCLGSLSCWKVQWHPSFGFLTDLLEGPMTPKLWLPHWWHDVFS